jgi:hypothetical protein
MWVGLIALVGVFAFVVGIAFSIVSDRVSGPPAGGEATLTPEAVAIGDITTTPTAPATSVTGTPTPSPSPASTATVTPTPTPANCDVPVEPPFQPLYRRDLLGCPTAAAAIVWSAWEPFERGSMLWRSDTDTAYVFLDNGEWGVPETRWDGQSPPDRGAPPPGLRAPERGFGFVWASSDEIFNALGWALDQEKGFCAIIQNFEHGFILQSTSVPSCTPDQLYNHAAAGDWTPVLLAATDNGLWYSSPIAMAVLTPPAGSPLGPAADMTRPPVNGLFLASFTSNIELDGDLEEWNGNWMPVHAIVHGGDKHDGPDDLSGNFLLGWTPQALCLAVRVNDDHYRVGPDGTDLWQGDGLEIQFDRDLPGDFSGGQADGDDYQIGVAFGRRLDRILGYQWLPFDKEGELAIPGAVIETRLGYDLEVCPPWSTFDVDGGALQGGEVFGFNLSINDNDGSRPEQESVASASAQRTTHDNPTEWGTLTLVP